MNVSSLFNVLVSTFSVMVIGYILPKLEIVEKTAVSKGLGGVVAKLMLPAVLFKQMANLEIGTLDWKVVILSPSPSVLRLCLVNPLESLPNVLIQFTLVSVCSLFTRHRS